MSDHICHWPGCGKKCPPKLWGCKGCWFKLPKELRDMIWRTYRPGQEIDKKPSRAYIAAAALVQIWIVEHYPATQIEDSGPGLFEEETEVPL